MRTPWIAVAATLLVSLAAHAQPSGPDKRLPQMILDELDVTDASLADCRYRNGSRIDADQCKRWQDKLAQVRAEIAAADRQIETDRREADLQRQANADQRAAQAEQRQRAVEAARAEDEARRRSQAEKEAAWHKELAARAAAETERRRAEDARWAAETAAAEAADARRVAALRKACGKDYMTPRIGMPIERALQCLGKFRRTGQVNRKDGVLTTYTNGSAMLQEIDGKLVSWVEY